MDLTIGEKGGEVPFECKIGMMAKFKVEQEVLPDDFQKFLDVNAPALLMSYTRPVVSFVASQAGFSSFNIPFMNFTEDGSHTFANWDHLCGGATGEHGTDMSAIAGVMHVAMEGEP